MTTSDIPGTFTANFTADLDQPVPALHDAAPAYTIAHYQDGTVVASVTDAHGNRVNISATSQAQPWLVRYAMRKLLPSLMPGGRREAANA